LTRDEIIKIDSIKKIITDNVKFNEIYDQFLYDPDNIPFSFKNIPDIFTKFRKELEKKGEIIPLVKINKKPKPLKVKNNLKIPSLEDLGYKDFEVDNRTAFPFEGGEINAIERLNEYLFKTKLIGDYKNTRNGLLGTNYSSKFSPWLANGSLSARQIFKNVKDFEIKYFSNQSTYWMIFELIWRDFFKYVSLKHKNKIFKLNGILNIEYNWSTNKKHIDNWINGTTSNDFVNANMIELKSTGWMSNRGRQNVASYFAKNMKMDWRIGASYFESMLIDYDVHSNYGNWIYVSGVGNDPRDRFFNLKRQAEIYDGDRKFRKKWL
jgi:deoxyribodipyrimidine photo-lyase